jgi:hypothetical protein
MARHRKDDTIQTHPISVHTVDGTKGNTNCSISSPLPPYMYMLCCRWHSFHHYHLLSFSSVFLSPFPFTLFIVCFRFLFSGTGAVESVLVGERGSGVERGFMSLGPGCSPSIGVSSSCDCNLTESIIHFMKIILVIRKFQC